MAMRILMTGATGFVGRALVQLLARDGHQLTAWVRNRDHARAALPAGVRLIEAPASGAASEVTSALIPAVQEADAVINLAGEPIAGGRWTASRRKSIADSRIALTDQLVDALTAATPRPQVLISASAVGYYGDRGEQLLDEDSGPGTGFLADICVGWERAAGRASALGVRVLRMRQGVVLGRGGGFLARLLPLVRKGLGAPLGNGQQFLPWIHLDDLLDVVAHALTDPQFEGALDLVASQPLRMSEVMRALAGVVGRRLLPGVPAILLRAALGQSAEVVLGSQRLSGERLRARHPVRFATIEAALADLVSAR
jgi:uncharacterized protein (TIGR01777 family)